jgi:hypothetical protein
LGSGYSLKQVETIRRYMDKLSKRINFEIFKGLLENKLGKQAKAPGDDYVLMFKILTLQRSL